MKIGVLTLSDKGARGERTDTSGAAIRELLAPLGAEVRRAAIIPDELEGIVATLAEWSDGGDLDLIVTTGGTGLAPRDVTPEATLRVGERLAPGISELMRAEGLRHTPMAALSRAVAGVRGRTLIVNLPGQPKAIAECLDAVFPAIPYCIDLIGGPYLTTNAERVKAFRPAR